MRRASIGCAKSVFENSVLGSTGHWPVLSGDSPDGTGATVRGNRHGLFATLLAQVPVGGSPTGAGGSPAPPIFKTGSNLKDCGRGQHFEGAGQASSGTPFCRLNA